MKQLAWITDPHLNFVGTQQIETFLQQVAAEKPDGVLITGDIGEAPSITDYLFRIGAFFDQPVYFVLGNHDFYGGSVSAVRAAVRKVCASQPNLHYLSDAGVIELTPDTALVGHDGWADGRLGNYFESPIMLNDYVLIRDFMGRDHHERLDIMQRLADDSAAELKVTLTQALANFSQVYVGTHVPPFAESCWYDGKLSDDYWMPHFTSKAVGDVLLEVAAASPHKRIIVLCGHTHGEGTADPLPNLHVITGGAEYEHPAVNQVVQLDQTPSTLLKE